MTKLRVLLADDHALFRDGIASLLTAWDMQVVGQAENGQQAIEKAGVLKPDLILMDINMPEVDGLQATREIKALYPEIQIVILTVSEDDDHLFEAIKSGAQGYLLKNLDAEEFNNLLEGLMRGEAALPRTLATKILAEFAKQSTDEQNDTSSSDEKQLTEREQDVLELLANGHSNRDIADELSVSENTVKYHVRNILSKLHLQNRAQVAAYAIRKGLVDSSVD